MIGSTLAVIIIGISASSLISLGKATTGAGNYADMNFRSRMVLEKFGADIRAGSSVIAFTDSRFEFNYLDSSNIEQTVVYEYNSGDKKLYRTEGGVTRSILENLSEFELDYFNLRLVDVPTGSSTNSVKGVRVDARMEQKVVTLGTSNEILSARFMMRNRLVSN